jgi:hypothetical protein
MTPKQMLHCLAGTEVFLLVKIFVFNDGFDIEGEVLPTDVRIHIVPKVEQTKLVR